MVHGLMILCVAAVFFAPRKISAAALVGLLLLSFWA